MPKMASLLMSTFLILALGLSVQSADDRFERGRFENILDVVSKDVQKNFYDPSMKGLDWKALTDQARQRIRNADHLGEMVAAISALLAQLHDSHTYFIPPGRTSKAIYGFEAKPFGNDILVYELDDAGPAAKAGLQMGDKILGVNQFNAQREDFFEMMRYVRFLNPTTEMELEVVRGSGRPLTIRIPTKLEQRSRFMVWDYREMVERWDAQRQFYLYRNYDGNVGYVKLRTFVVDPGEITSAMSKARDSSALILDLRENGGGYEAALTELLGYFADEPYEAGQSVSRGGTEPLKVKSGRTITLPLVILVDSASASASEIFARALQLRKRAVVIGDRTSGRVNRARLFWGKVGAYDMVAFATAVTVARLILRNGEGLENRGVTPDEFCIQTADDLRNTKDPCLDRARALLSRAGSAGSGRSK
jgi:carboxyl-terminal processing protease